MPAASAARQLDARGRIHVLEVLGNAITGGMEHYVLRLLGCLPPERFRTSVLCPFESPFTSALREQGADVFVTPMPPDDLPWSSVQMASALVRSGGVDLLHAHLPNASQLAALAAALTGRPLLTTIHARTLSTQDLEIHRALGSHLAVVCRQTYFQALALGVSAGQVSWIPNGVDTRRFTPRPAGPRAPLADGLRARLGVPAGAPLAGFIGRLHWEKGPDVFVHAALLACQRCPDAHFVLIGEGPMQASLEAQVRDFSRGGRIHFAGLQDDMPAACRALDLAVSSSHSEAMPFAVLEAMASGLPVIATQVGGLPELVEQGHTGYLVAPGDARAIADLLALLLTDPATCARMGQRARQRCVEAFELRDCAERTSRLLLDLAEGAHAGPARVSTLPAGGATAAPARRRSGKQGG
ncbi:MAG: glycosyltransferase [Candidatus Dactylopiibacterium sp.]|nr:glycosyltransferase [Candidatus Dactylopiibacterium sp.]